MPGQGKISAIVLIVIVCMFGYGVYHLFSLRFEKGDIYPPYSSLRSDPLGSKALYGSLGRVRGIGTCRNFLDPSKLAGEKGRTIFFLGVDANLIHSFTKKQADDLEALAVNGNRLVIAFAPARRELPGAQSGGDTGNTEKGSKNEGPRECLFEKWGIAPDYSTGAANAQKEASLQDGETDLPPTVSWHTGLFFRIDNRRWRPVYSIGGKPVVIERFFGQGSVVILSDSYLASNEAMRNERRPHLLAWLQGPNPTAVFDEYHLGVFDSPGVMSLMRKYNLAPFILGLVVLAGLYMWKSSVPLVPWTDPDGAGDNGNTTDKDNFGGLVNLLSRAVAPQTLLDVCFQEWSKSFSRGGKVPASTLERIQSVLDKERAAARGDRDPAAGYRKISKILAERNIDEQ